MTILQAILLGIIQGLTEFLPISSSAHLVIIPFLLGWEIPAAPAFVFNVLVQLGTLVAVIVYFWKDLLGITKGFIEGLLARQPFKTSQSRLGWYILLATIPAGVFGLLIKDLVEAAFNSPLATGIFLLCTAVILVIAERLSKLTRSLEEINWLDALLMGIFQALAVFPGISRSGSTMTGGLLRNLDRPSAARFSFLMSIPIMLAAGVLATLDLLEIPDLSQQIVPVTVGFLAAAVVGYLSIRWLLGYLTRHSFYSFAVYCVAAGLLTVVIAILRN
jgi:undecaprenyl-diphosphatase